MINSTATASGYEVSLAKAGVSVALLSAATTAQKSSAFESGGKVRTFQALGTTTAGAGAATAVIQGSNVPTPTVDGDWTDLGTISLTLSTTKSNAGFVSDAAWRHTRVNLSAISGTGASVDVYMGE